MISLSFIKDQVVDFLGEVDGIIIGAIEKSFYVEALIRGLQGSTDDALDSIGNSTLKVVEAPKVASRPVTHTLKSGGALYRVEYLNLSSLLPQKGRLSIKDG